MKQMFSRFTSNIAISNRIIADSDTIHLSRNMPDKLRALMAQLGGSSLDNGLYRVHTFSSSYYWESIIGNYFAAYKDKICPFSFDWMGRQFALDLKTPDRILMFDPATAEDFLLNESLEVFHNETLVDDRLETLAEDNFLEALKSLKKPRINFDQCIGYKKPLFLGGVDSFENYEVADLEVYWDIQSQIYHQIKNLPPGTKINSVSFE
ncbi:T6SS immunity protein Tdi1 domain-containing protein [Ohtaekwangia kribbensis]|uniref:T6SS immunity protein Tdi1 domain-containing protein n=1 Tax=Ohtaekwangia kribbensis TaxID=688913 RepID=A0ABW3K654_9BACT